MKEDIPAFCKNEECDNYNCFELYSLKEIQIEFTKNDDRRFVYCSVCGRKIYLDNMV